MASPPVAAFQARFSDGTWAINGKEHSLELLRWPRIKSHGMLIRNFI
jgi:hypothetical protein